MIKGLKQSDKVILNKIRGDSRKTLVQISNETGVPVSTLANKLKNWESSIILKHSSLIDFKKLGYPLKVGFILQGGNKARIEGFLSSHPNVNSLSRLIGNHDLYAECLFKDLNELSEFKQTLLSFDVKSLEQIDLLEEIKREDFRIE